MLLGRVYSMRSFDELVEIYDNALAEAKAKLPDVITYPNDRIQVPVILETSIIKSLSDTEIAKDSTLNPNMLVFEFVKHRFKGWVLNAP